MQRSNSLKKFSTIIFIVALALIVRGLTANFLRAHLNDPGWFQSGSFSIFDRQAQDVLDGKQRFFWISDSTRTDLIQYPPGNLVWIGAIYTVTGERSAASVQRVQWVIDAFAVLLIVAIAVTAYGWTTGVIAGLLAALSPLLALYSATPGADMPTSWLVLAGVWLSLLAFKRKSVGYAIGAGALMGLSCWLRVNPLLLFVPWAVAFYFLLKDSRKNRALFSIAISASALLVVTPLIARNLIVFYPEVAPTGLNVGWNLLAGIGETDRGREFGAPCCDADIIQQDRQRMGLPPDAPLGLVYPDGIRRDKERAQRALAIIKAHPGWYAGVMVKRTLTHLKLAGKPTRGMGYTGLNVTSPKCLPTHLQFIPFSTAVNLLGMIQSVLRYTAVLFMAWGIWVCWRTDFRITLLILSTVIYFLVTLAVAHSEIRYGLPMQGLLIVFQARGLYDVFGRIKRQRSAPAERVD